MFEKRHYDQVAAVIGKLVYGNTTDAMGKTIRVREHLIEDFITMFREDNPKFSSARFVEAIAKTEGREDVKWDCQHCGKAYGH